MRNPICLFIGIWRSLKHRALITGHDYHTAAYYQTPPNIHVLTCRRCGKLSISWGWDNLEEQK